MQIKHKHMIVTPAQLLNVVKGWCFDCGMPAPDYMVHTEVWNAAWPPSDPMSRKRIEKLKREATKAYPERERSPDSNLVLIHIELCFGCLERRLGRRLEITDFQLTNRRDELLTINTGIFLGYTLGKRAARQEFAKKSGETGDKKDEGG